MQDDQPTPEEAPSPNHHPPFVVTVEVDDSQRQFLVTLDGADLDELNAELSDVAAQAMVDYLLRKGYVRPVPPAPAQPPDPSPDG